MLATHAWTPKALLPGHAADRQEYTPGMRGLSSGGQGTAEGPRGEL
jgi:hypothetical protein